MKPSSLAASLALHALVLGALVLPPAGSPIRRLAPRPVPTPPLQLVMLELAKLKAETPPDHGTIAYPKKKPRPAPVAKTPAPTPTPKPQPVAAKPTPSPTPSTSPKDKAIFDALRKYPQYAGLTDEQIRKMPLPPGMKDWASVLAMTGQLDKLDWTVLPPDTGKDASGSAMGGFFGWAPGQIGPDSNYMGGPKREKVGDRWRFAFQYFATVMVAEWKDGSTVAQVAYYPVGGKPDPAKVFPVQALPKDEELSAQMITQYTLVSMGQPPAPVPTDAVSSR